MKRNEGSGRFAVVHTETGFVIKRYDNRAKAEAHAARLRPISCQDYGVKELS